VTFALRAFRKTVTPARYAGFRPVFRMDRAAPTAALRLRSNGLSELRRPRSGGECGSSCARDCPTRLSSRDCRPMHR
jgi:hypothetical protein